MVHASVKRFESVTIFLFFFLESRVINILKILKAFMIKKYRRISFLNLAEAFDDLTIMLVANTERFKEVQY